MILGGDITWDAGALKELIQVKDAKTWLPELKWIVSMIKIDGIIPCEL